MIALVDGVGVREVLNQGYERARCEKSLPAADHQHNRAFRFPPVSSIRISSRENTDSS